MLPCLTTMTTSHHSSRRHSSGLPRKTHKSISAQRSMSRNRYACFARAKRTSSSRTMNMTSVSYLKLTLSNCRVSISTYSFDNSSFHLFFSASVRFSLNFRVFTAYRSLLNLSAHLFSLACRTCSLSIICCRRESDERTASITRVSSPVTSCSTESIEMPDGIRSWPLKNAQ